MSGRHRERSILLSIILATTILVPGVFFYVGTQNAHRAQAEFDRVVSDASRDIRLRVTSYEFGARGARGAIVAAGVEQISRRRFLAYMSTRDLPVEFPGALGFGFIRRVPREELVGFLDSARADDYPQFSIRELDAHAGDHYIIQYIEPGGVNSEAIGLDIGSEANRRLAADRAMSSGMATLTEPVTLVQATGKPARGFLLLLPVFDPDLPQETPAQRRHALVGWAYAPLIIDDVLEHLGGTLDDFSLSILDPDSDDVTEPFYSSVRPVYDEAPRVRRELELFGRRWDMQFTASRSFSDSLGLVSPWAPAGAILALGLLSALLVRYYYNADRMRRHIQQGQARTDALVNQSLDAIVELDADWYVIRANSAAEQMLSPPGNEGGRRQLFDCLDLGEGENDLREALQHASEDARQATRELLVRRPEGGESRNVAVITLLHGPDDRPAGLSLTLRDISRQRAVEETLSEILVLTSAQLGKEFMQAAADALGRLLKAKLVTIDQVDPEHPDEAFVLAAHCEGLDAEPWRYVLETAVNSQSAPPAASVLDSSLRSPNARMLFDKAGGLSTPLPGMKASSCISISLNDADHRRFGHLAVFHGQNAVHRDFERDFEVARLFSQRIEAELWRMVAEKDRLRAESELREVNESLERLAAQRTTELRHTLIIQARIVAGAGVALIATDPEGIITLFNPAAELLLGRQAQDLVGKTTPALFHDPDEVEERAAEISRALDQPFPPGFAVFIHGVGPEQATSRDWTYIHASGDRIPVRLGISQLRDDDGTVLGYLGVAVDMRAEREQAQLLRRAVERSEAATRTKSEFLANVSHEIRTPLNAILGMMQLLATTPLELRQKEYVRKSQGAAHSLLSILNDVLDYSKMEAGMMAVERQPFSLQALLTDLSVICEGLDSKPCVEIAFDLDARLSDCMVGDALRLKQVLTNLLGNAMKFTDQGLILLAIRPVSAVDGVWRVEFSVRDTGIGVPEELQSHIFGVFAQAEADTARRYGGTGLGLPICDRLVGLMGGRMSLRSSPGNGSMFYFTLDLEACDAPPARPEPLKLSVLAFEAGEVSRDILLGHCRRLGCEAVWVDTVQAAAGQLAQREFDVLLVGLGANPVEDDHHILRLVESHQHRIGLGTVLMASGSRQNICLEVEEGGLERVRCLSKPVMFAQLQTSLVALAEGSGNGGSASKVPVAHDTLAGVHALVIEDNAVNREVVHDLLSAEGAEVLLCVSGADALEKLDRAPGWPTVVLTDIQMPGLDGFEVARRIRRDPRFADLPILALTAHASQADRDECRAAGMDEHVAKPLDIADLREKILACIRPKAKGKPAASKGTGHALVGMDAAARRLGGHPTAYLRVLRGFVDHAPGLLRSMLDLGTPLQERLRAAHTLRGNGLTAGQDALARLAQDAEASLHSSQQIGPQLAAQLSEALDVSLDAAGNYLRNLVAHPAPGPGEASRMSAPERIQRLTELSELLGQCDMRSVTVAESIALAWPVPHPERLGQLLALVQKFEFDAARRCCGELVSIAEEFSRREDR